MASFAKVVQAELAEFGFGNRESRFPIEIDSVTESGPRRLRFCGRLFDDYDIEFALTRSNGRALAATDIDCAMCEARYGRWAECEHWKEVLVTYMREFQRPQIDEWLARVPTPEPDDYVRQNHAVVVDLYQGKPYLRFMAIATIGTAPLRSGRKHSIEWIEQWFRRHPPEDSDARRAFQTLVTVFRNDTPMDDGTHRIPTYAIYDVLKAATLSGAGYLDIDSEFRPLTMNPKGTLDFEWSVDQDHYRLQSMKLGDGYYYFESQTMVHLAKSGEITPFTLANELAPEHAETLLEMPGIPVEEAPATFARVIDHWPAFPVPPPAEVLRIVDLDDSRLVNVLRIVNEQGAMQADLSYRYYRGLYLDSPYEPVSVVTKGDKTYRVLRNEGKESQAQARLRSIGLYGLANQGMRFVAPAQWQVQRQEDARDKVFWARFLDSEVPRLEAEGWKVFGPDKKALDIVDCPTVNAAIEDAADNSELYKMSLGIEVDGQYVSLLPLVMEVINEMGGRSEIPEHKYGYLTLENGQLLRIPGARYRALVRLVIDSLEYLNSAGDAVEMPIGRADEVGVLDDYFGDDIAWQRSGRVGKLVDVFNDWVDAPTASIPDTIKATLNQYQLDGVSRMAYMAENGFSMLLCDEMGLGKTLQMLSVYAIEKARDPSIGPALVCVNTAGLRQWEKQVAQHCPSLVAKQTGEMSGKNISIDERFGMYGQCESGDIDVLVSTYDKVNRDIERVREIPWHCVFADESHLINNPRGKKRSAIKSIDVARRFPATGTPIENNLMELWALVDVAMPGYFGSEKWFREHYAKPIQDEQDLDALKRLRRRLTPILRRKRRNDEDVDHQIPEPDIEVIEVELGSTQRDLYEAVRVREEKAVKEMLKEKGLKQSRGMVLSNILGMRQVACDPRIYTMQSHSVTASEKLRKLTGLLHQFKQDKTPALVFSNFKSMMPLMRGAADRVGIASNIISGDVPIKKRTPIVKRFQNGDVNVLFATLGTMNASLDLFEAKATVLYEPWWNPQKESQGIGRMVRRGQEHKTTVYRLYARNTVEGHLMKKQDDKLALVDAVLNEDIEALSQQLSEADIRAFFSY